MLEGCKCRHASSLTSLCFSRSSTRIRLRTVNWGLIIPEHQDVASTDMRIFLRLCALADLTLLIGERTAIYTVLAKPKHYLNPISSAICGPNPSANRTRRLTRMVCSSKFVAPWPSLDLSLFKQTLRLVCFVSTERNPKLQGQETSCQSEPATRAWI